MTNHKALLLALLGATLLQACVPLVLGGAGTTAGVIHDRRTTGTVIDDNTLELNLRSKLSANKNIADNSHINVTSYNGQVLLTGEAFNEQIRAQAVSIIESVPTVKVVRNQIVIGRKSTLLERAYDSKQTGKVKIALVDVDIPTFDPTRVKVVTEHGITYLMGLVSEQEARAATNIVSRVSGVKEVVTFFEIR